jgi:hypothetical protein
MLKIVCKGLLVCAIAMLTSNMVSQNISEEFKTKFTAHQLEKSPVKLIPYPQSVVWGKQHEVIHNLWFADYDNVSKIIKDELYQICTQAGIELNNKSFWKIEFIKDSKLKKEEYHMEVIAKKISIRASSDNGFFYALKTLRQLIEVKGEICSIQHCSIQDQPAFSVRGYMIDVGRNFQSIKAIKKHLDIMADYKLNTFHWHLTDRPAWRVESKIYPQLNDPTYHRSTRDPGFYYTFDEVRELIRYANERMINVIPELDMPGHSEYFHRTFGFKMESEKGMLVLEALLNEFFNEIPKEMAPLIHLGSDEVHVHNPKEFVDKMVSHVEANGRRAIIWHPGLQAEKSVIRQVWGGKDPIDENGYDVIDSDKSYINNVEPMTNIPSLFFKPIGKETRNNTIGGIICLWPDVNIKRENDIITQNPLYPSLNTYAWTTWTADVISAPEDYQLRVPAGNTNAYRYFKAYESFLMNHKQKYFKNEPFQYFSQTDKYWKIIGPFSNNDGDDILKDKSRKSYRYNGQTLKWQQAIGTSIMLNHEYKKGGHVEKMDNGNVYYALAFINSDLVREVPVWIGFDCPARNSRNYVGVANDGEFDMGGGTVWVNDEKVEGPNWQNKRISRFDEEWKTLNNHEIPWRAEELFYTRKPTIIRLRKGQNEIFIKVPKSKFNPYWMFTFTLLDETGLTYIK